MARKSKACQEGHRESQERGLVQKRLIRPVLDLKERLQPEEAVARSQKESRSSEASKDNKAPTIEGDSRKEHKDG